jgi:hypothetical protein
MIRKKGIFIFDIEERFILTIEIFGKLDQKMLHVSVSAKNKHEKKKKQ